MNFSASSAPISFFPDLRGYIAFPPKDFAFAPKGLAFPSKEFIFSPMDFHKARLLYF